MKNVDAGDQIDCVHVRTLLETRRRRLSQDLHFRAARIREHGANPVPPSDRDETERDDLDLSLLEIAAATLQHIDGALERLDSGRYGWCLRCHRRIAEARLRAMPSAVRCRECESAREREAAARRAALRAGWSPAQRVRAESTAGGGEW